MKRAGFIALLVAICFISNSQVLHVSSGITYSKLDWVFSDPQILSERHYSAPMYGYSFAAGVEYLEYKMISVTSNLMVYRSGGKNSSEENSNQMIFQEPDQVSLDYLSIGTMLNFYPVRKKIEVMVQLGPRFDLLEGGEDKSPLSWVDNKKGLNKTNFGFTAGTGISYTKGDFTFGLEGLYLYRKNKLVDLSLKYSGLGADASEKIFQLNFNFGWKIRQFNDQ